MWKREGKRGSSQHLKPFSSSILLELHHPSPIKLTIFLSWELHKPLGFWLQQGLPCTAEISAFSPKNKQSTRNNLSWKGRCSQTLFESGCVIHSLGHTAGLWFLPNPVSEAKAVCPIKFTLIRRPQIHIRVFASSTILCTYWAPIQKLSSFSTAQTFNWLSINRR